MRRACVFNAVLLGVLVGVTILGLVLCAGPAWSQGQMIPGNRTIAGTFNAGPSTGTSSAYELILNPPITAYVTDQYFAFRAHTANTGATTLNVNGVGARPLRKWQSATLVDLVSGDIAAGREVMVLYDGAVFQVLTLGTAGGGGGGGGGATSVGNAGGIQAADGSGGFAAYSGNTCTTPGTFARGLSQTGTLDCQPSTTATLTARPLLQQPATDAPNGFNLGALGSGVLRLGVSGGVATPSTLAQPNGALVGTDGPQTLINTGVTPRWTSLANTTNSVSVNVDTTDLITVANLLQPLTIGTIQGSADPGQWIRFELCSASPQGLTWTSQWSGEAGLPLPTQTRGGGVCDMLLFQYNSTTGRLALVSNVNRFGDLCTTTLPPGDYTNTNLTVDSRGCIAAISTGTGGTGSGGVPTSRSLTISGTTNEVAVAGGTQDLSVNRAWTVSLPTSLNLGTHTLLGGTPLVFEGATVDGNQTSLVVVNPTSPRTLTVPDANSVAVQPNAGTANQFVTGISALGVVSTAQPSSTTLSDGGNLVLKNAVNTFTGSGALTGLPSPSVASDVATKGYVDGVAVGLTAHTAVRVGTVAALTATYANGTAGVGATLTNSGTLAALSLDGVGPLSVNDRVLVKNQTTQFQNGMYTVTTVGSGAVAWVLTRATDADQSGELAAGNYTIVNEGTTLAHTMWVQNTTGTITVGTTAVVFVQLSTASVSPLTNIPDDTIIDNKMRATAVAPPATPAAGFGYVYFDSSSKTLASKDDTGGVKHGVQTATATASQWLRSVDDAGLFTKSQPAFADLTGQATAAQVPNLEALNGLVPVAKGGLGFTDGTLSGTTHRLATVSGSLVSGNCVRVDTNGNFVDAGVTCGGGGGGGGTANTAGVPGDVQFNLANSLAADPHNFAYEPVSQTLAVQNTQLGQAGGYLKFTDSGGRKSYLFAASKQTNTRIYVLPNEDGELCVKGGTGCGGGGGGSVGVAGTPATGQTAEWTNATTVQGIGTQGAGNYVKAATAGASSATFLRGDFTWATPAGAGNVSNVGTPTSGQLAEWTSATSIQGVTTQGTGAPLRQTSPIITTPSIAALANLTANGVVTTTGGNGTLAVDQTAVQTLTSSITYTCQRNGTVNQCKMNMTGGAGTLTIAAPTGTAAQDGDRMLMRIRCTNAQTLVLDAIFIASANVPLPTSCPADTTREVMIGALYSSDITKWQIIASTN
jgi:hypothetical protein